eukprot:jgi/Chlat1/16/ChrspC226771S00901
MGGRRKRRRREAEGAGEAVAHEEDRGDRAGERHQERGDGSRGGGGGERQQRQQHQRRGMPPKPLQQLVTHPDDYIIKDGRRWVRPYFFDFISHVKPRWEGRSVINIFEDEFKGRTRQYYEEAMRIGRLTVLGERVDAERTVHVGEWLCHHVHRHEPPVTPDPINVLSTSEDFITVSKPGSIPVHPCGQYRKNTVLGLLQAYHPELGPYAPILCHW